MFSKPLQKFLEKKIKNEILTIVNKSAIRLKYLYKMKKKIHLFRHKTLKTDRQTVPENLTVSKIMTWGYMT